MQGLGFRVQGLGFRVQGLLIASSTKLGCGVHVTVGVVHTLEGVCQAVLGLMFWVEG